MRHTTTIHFGPAMSTKWLCGIALAVGTVFAIAKASDIYLLPLRALTADPPSPPTVLHLIRAQYVFERDQKIGNEEGIATLFLRVSGRTSFFKVAIVLPLHLVADQSVTDHLCASRPVRARRRYSCESGLDLTTGFLHGADVVQLNTWAVRVPGAHAPIVVTNDIRVLSDVSRPIVHPPAT